MSASLGHANGETSGLSPSGQRFVALPTKVASPRRVDSRRGTSHHGVNSPLEDASPSRHARRRVAPPVHEPRSCRSDRRGHGRCSCHTHPLRQNANRGFRATTYKAVTVFIIASSCREAPLHFRGSDQVESGMDVRAVRLRQKRRWRRRNGPHVPSGRRAAGWIVQAHDSVTALSAVVLLDRNLCATL
jgi:hypothetical protein